MAQERIFEVTTFKNKWLFDPTGQHEYQTITPGTYQFVLGANPLDPGQPWLTLKGSDPPVGVAYRAWAVIYSSTYYAGNPDRVEIKEIFPETE